MKMAPAKLKGGPYKVNKRNPNILEGVAAIANFIGKSPNTAKRWILEAGLPATKTPEGLWYTHKALILQWIYAGWRAEIAAQNGSVPERVKLDHHLSDMLEEENLDALEDKVNTPASEIPL
jgi:hypothetical protein